MSTRIMAIVWPVKTDMTAKAVLVSLADNANDNGECWPSIETISERTCISRRSVIDAIQRLERDGLVVADRANGRHTKYLLTVDNQCATRTSAPAAPVRQVHDTRAPAALDPCASRTGPVRQPHTNRQEPSLNRQGTRESAREAPAPARSPAGSRIPDGFPADDEIAWCREHRPDLDSRGVADRFRDHWLAAAGASGRKADWPATWRNWVRREGRQNAPPARRQPAHSDVVAQLTGRSTTPKAIDVTPLPATRVG